MSSHAQYLAEGDSLRSIVEDRARRDATSPYLLATADGSSITYGDLGLLIEQWGTRLAQSDVVDGDRMGLIIADPLQFGVGFVAALCAGVWVAPLDPHVAGTDVQSLNHQVERLGLAGVLSDRPALPGLNCAWVDLKASPSGQAIVHDQLNEVRRGGGVVLASSGTTGAPKVMSLGVDQLLFVGRAVARHNALDSDDRGLNMLPLWHINAEVVGLLATLVAGSSLVLDDRFHRNGFWALAKRMGVTWINAVPAIIARLAVLDDGETVPDGVRFVRSASAPLSATVLDRFEQVTGLAVIESYGMTEAGSQICANPLAGPRKPGSVGQPVGVEVRVSPSEPGVAPGVGVIGEVEIHGPSVIVRYDASGYEDRFTADGWLKTRDLGYVDDDGFLFLVGRIDDVINRGGEKIFPREIEDIVLSIDSVESAALVGVADEVYGQVPVLFVQLTSDTSPISLDDARNGVKAIRDVLVASVARTRRPSHINVVIDMPTHATGKIRRKDLEAGLVDVLVQEPVL
jgi:acyl-CoA synthetase (AMP-forming)/AMP-acid ligase II